MVGYAIPNEVSPRATKTDQGKASVSAGLLLANRNLDYFFGGAMA